jgi:ferredoxin
MSEIISHDALRRLVDTWLGQGKRVLGPSRVKPDLVTYEPLTKSEQLALGEVIHPGNTIKETVFPRHEKLYNYRLQGKQIELTEAEAPTVDQIVVGARPCDAAALSILDKVFNWDFKDSLYNRRRALTTVITLACSKSDEHCFCSSVDCGPEDPRGSDVMLFDLGDGTYEVRCLTEKGKALFGGQTKSSDKVGKACSAPETALDLDAIGRFLKDGFEKPQWATYSVRCLGCGACAFNCPTCHCFDIVDEGNAAGGSRVRNWDACQFTQFTLHASGHNPRANQAQRQRQRIFHKFQIYPEKFGEVLCTGCGNCTRNCPVSLGVRPVLQAIEQDQSGTK